MKAAANIVNQCLRAAMIKDFRDSHAGTSLAIQLRLGKDRGHYRGCQGKFRVLSFAHRTSQSTVTHTKVLLVQLETQLRAGDLWQSHYPSATALASQQPFAVDTLTFAQWLQFIFIPRLQALIDAEQPLPTNIAVSPMAEQALNSTPAEVEIVSTLQQIDILLSGQDPLAQTESTNNA